MTDIIDFEARRADRTAIENLPILGAQLALSISGLSLLVEAGSAEIYLGRAADCRLRIQRPYISRIHARIVADRQGFHLIDMSINGTYVRTDRGQAYKLVSGSLRLNGAGSISLGTRLHADHADLIRYLV